MAIAFDIYLRAWKIIWRTFKSPSAKMLDTILDGNLLLAQTAEIEDSLNPSYKLSIWRSPRWATVLSYLPRARD
jgi:hypothetical protein